MRTTRSDRRTHVAHGRRLPRPWAAQADAALTIVVVAGALFTVALDSDLRATATPTQEDLRVYDAVLESTKHQIRGRFAVVDRANSVPFIEGWSRRVGGLHDAYRRAVYDLNISSGVTPRLDALSDWGFRTAMWEDAEKMTWRQLHRNNRVWLSAVGYNREASTAVVLRAFCSKHNGLRADLILLFCEGDTWKVEDSVALYRG